MPQPHAPIQPHGAVRRSKIIVAPVGPDFADEQAAWDALDLHRQALLADGNTWATSGWPGCGPFFRVEEGAAGLLIGLRTPSLADPAGTQRIDFTASEWELVPPE